MRVHCSKHTHNYSSSFKYMKGKLWLYDVVVFPADDSIMAIVVLPYLLPDADAVLTMRSYWGMIRFITECVSEWLYLYMHSGTSFSYILIIQNLDSWISLPCVKYNLKLALSTKYCFTYPSTFHIFKMGLVPSSLDKWGTFHCIGLVIQLTHIYVYLYH